MKNQFFLLLSCYIHMKKKLNYKLQRCTINVSKFWRLISFTELITKFKKSRSSHKCNALSLKKQSQPLDGVTSAVQKCSGRSFRYFFFTSWVPIGTPGLRPAGPLPYVSGINSIVYLYVRSMWEYLICTRSHSDWTRCPQLPLQLIFFSFQWEV